VGPNWSPNAGPRRRESVAGKWRPIGAEVHQLRAGGLFLQDSPQTSARGRKRPLEAALALA